MQIIDAIIDLARTMEPGSKVEPKFALVRDRDGKWTAFAEMHTYWCDGKSDHSAEEALDLLFRQLVTLNNRAKESAIQRLARWFKGGKLSPKRVK